MQILWTGNDPLLLGLLQSELAAKGIRFEVKNIALQTALGELPPTAIWPEIWVLDDDRFSEAREILEDLEL